MRREDTKFSDLTGFRKSSELLTHEGDSKLCAVAPSMLLNRERAYSIMDNYGLEALVATTPANVTYLSGFRAMSHELLGSFIFVVFPHDPRQQSTVILPLGEAADLVALKMSWVKDVRPYGTFPVTVPEGKMAAWESDVAKLFTGKSESDPFVLLGQVLDEKGLSRRKVGLDEHYFTSQTYSRLVKTLDRFELVPAYDIFREIRSVKNSEQVEVLKEAIKITEEGIRTVIESTRIGMTGNDLVKIFVKTVTERGAVPIVPTIALAKDSYLQYIYIPSNRKLRTGDLLRFDVCCMYKYHYTDIGRNAVLGKATATQERLYKVVYSGEEEALNLLRPGVKASDVFQGGVKGARNAGMPNFKRNHCGHGIGLELYEPPLIMPSNESLIEQGNVINIETPYYEIGTGGFMVEDTVLVTRTGIQFLTKFDRALYEIPT